MTDRSEEDTGVRRTCVRVERESVCVSESESLCA